MSKRPTYAIDENTKADDLEAQMFEDAVDCGIPAEIAARIAAKLASDAIERRDRLVELAAEAKRLRRRRRIEVILWVIQAFVAGMFVNSLIK